jgi:glycosyltransferase involved in cell wall biosynthesis
MVSSDITVLTSVRNRPNLLAETIECVQAQTLKIWEYIIVDDASDDETPDVIQSYIKHDGRLYCVRRSESGGPFLANMDGVKKARGKYIFNIDSDDLSPVNRLEKQLEFLELHPNLRACISPWWSFNDQGLIPGGKVFIPIRAPILKWALMLRPFASHSSLCIEKNALLEIGGYSPVCIGGDYELLCKLSRKGWLGVVPEVLSYVRRHEGKISRLAEQKAGANPTMNFLREHAEALIGHEIGEETIQNLYAIGTANVASVTEGLKTVEIWREFWMNDLVLNGDDRRELSDFGDYQIWRFLHTNLYTQPSSCVFKSLNLIFKRPSSVIQLFHYLIVLLVSRFGNYHSVDGIVYSREIA